MNEDQSRAPTDPSFCRDLDEEVARQLLKDAESVHVSAGTVLFRTGDDCDGLYLVRSGRLERVERDATTAYREGDLFGVVEALSREERTGTVSAALDSDLLRVPMSSLDTFLATQPEATEALAGVAERRLLDRELVRLLPEVFQTSGPSVVHEMSRRFRWVQLGRGEKLFSQGDAGDALYILVSGRLRVELQTESGPRVVGEVAPGETVGEMSLLTGEPRSATVVALRDSVLQECGREDFDALMEKYPGLSMHLAGILVERLKRANRRTTGTRGRMSIAVVPLHDGIDPDVFIRPFVRTIETFGSVLHLDRNGLHERVGHEMARLDVRLQDLRLLPWLEEQESRHDTMVYETAPTPTSWTMLCVGQADRIVLLTDADREPSPGELEERIGHHLSGARPPVHLVLLHPEDRESPRDTLGWLEDREIHRHHHVRRGRHEDVERVARLLMGRGLGLVLSGGGARGFGHIGVIRVLRELGIPIDAVGGTSAGAAVGAGYAMGRTTKQIRDLSKYQFADQKPLSKYTLPVYSLVGRRGVDRTYRELFDDRDITDLWIPYLCTSCDIHTGEKVVHVKGPLWKAARASGALPGILPPVIDGERLLVDGGVLDNIPEGEMKEFCEGTVIAVDVGPGSPIPVDIEYEEMPSPWRILWDRVNPFGRPVRVPGILEILVRTATVSNASQHGLVDEIADLVLRPPVQSYGLLDFAAIDSIIEDAVPYCEEQLSAWWAEREERLEKET